MGPAADQSCCQTLYALAADGAGRWVEMSVDTAVEPPFAGFVNLQVPPELEAKLTRLAAETGRTADQVALDLLASSVDHDEWFRSEVEKGRADKPWRSLLLTTTEIVDTLH
jgi:predicted transcriptional regulator